mmetsp:Transcript_16039/g.29391  ORF Transcript_16039/g.29391 Transcript_16039/m.29391 type:complete len:495 (+) Transcript_16039:1017-2501(+)
MERGRKTKVIRFRVPSLGLRRLSNLVEKGQEQTKQIERSKQYSSASPPRVITSREASPMRYFIEQKKTQAFTRQLSPSHFPTENSLISVRLDLTQKRVKHQRGSSLGNDSTSKRDHSRGRPSSLERANHDSVKENVREHFELTAKISQTVEDCAERERNRREKLRLSIERHYLKKGVIPQTTSEYYRYGEVLGKGAFGKVILGVHVLTGFKVAIKMIEKSYMQEERRRRKVFQEILAMRSIKSPYILPLYEVFESSNHLLLVIEYAPGGDLLHYVKNKGRLTEAEAAYFLKQLVEGLKACHARNIIHRDVKLDNILLDHSKTKVKLCDFGVCRVLKKGELINEHCGTPAYLAPEIIANVDYDGYCVDVWSLGVTLYAMVTGTLPFKAKNLPDLQKAVLKGTFELPSHLSNHCCSLLRGLLQLVPRQRLTLEQISEHPWVAYEVPPEHRIKPAVNEGILDSMKTLGFSRKTTIQSLKLKEMNHVTATYAILEHYL